MQNEQFERPSGEQGAIAGEIMAEENQAAIHWAVNLFAPMRTDRVLEISFGPGLGLKALSRYTPHVTGIDISQVMVEQAVERNEAACDAGRIDPIRAQVERIPFADSSFDRVITINSLHVWPDLEVGLDEIYRVLCPGGHFAVVEQPPSGVFDEAEMQCRCTQIESELLQGDFTVAISHYRMLSRGMAVCVIASCN